MEETIAVKKSHIMSVVGAVFIVVVFAFAAQAMIANSNISSNYENVKAAAAPLQGEKQVVKISIQGGTYYPNPVRLKKGITAVFEVDTSSVRGCYRSIQIPAFNVRKVVNDNNNRIEFTPDKAGTFGFSCSMGMGRGQIVVEDETGNVPSTVNTVAQDIPTGSSCGSGGGCGCGGG